ncbi:MAG TPA: hypothetical protein VFR60_05005 [Sphingomicrobium sp.]|nr:hypothetical protein [Sphingomicrobium sp.]
MANDAEIGDAPRRTPWRVAGWTIAALALLTPLVAMQFARDVNWTVGDYIFAGVVISALLGSLWLVSAALFGLAARSA